MSGLWAPLKPLQSANLLFHRFQFLKNLFLNKQVDNSDQSNTCLEFPPRFLACNF